MTDNYSDEEFAPIAAAMKELPYFAPSPDFADKVMARVRVLGAAGVTTVDDRRDVTPIRPRPIERVYAASSVERHTSYVPAGTDYRRSLPARIAVAGLVASFGVTMATVVLVSFFNVDLLLFVSRIFGAGTISYLTALAGDASATAAVSASSAVASAGTAAGAAVVGSFATGLVVATAALRAAASAGRKAA